MLVDGASNIEVAMVNDDGIPATREIGQDRRMLHIL
jgi:hypothetical protein